MRKLLIAVFLLNAFAAMAQKKPSFEITVEVNSSSVTKPRGEKGTYISYGPYDPATSEVTKYTVDYRTDWKTSRGLGAAVGLNMEYPLSKTLGLEAAFMLNYYTATQEPAYEGRVVAEQQMKVTPPFIILGEGVRIAPPKVNFKLLTLGLPVGLGWRPGQGRIKLEGMIEPGVVVSSPSELDYSGSLELESEGHDVNSFMLWGGAGIACRLNEHIEIALRYKQDLLPVADEKDVVWYTIPSAKMQTIGLQLRYALPVRKK